jgi:hypothetical protein
MRRVSRTCRPTPAAKLFIRTHPLTPSPLPGGEGLSHISPERKKSPPRRRRAGFFRIPGFPPTREWRDRKAGADHPEVTPAKAGVQFCQPAGFPPARKRGPRLKFSPFKIHPSPFTIHTSQSKTRLHFSLLNTYSISWPNSWAKSAPSRRIIFPVNISKNQRKFT